MTFINRHSPVAGSSCAQNDVPPCTQSASPVPGQSSTPESDYRQCSTLSVASLVPPSPALVQSFTSESDISQKETNRGRLCVEQSGSQSNSPK